MAYTLIGGTAVGTVLILLFLPALYAAWFRIKPTAEAAHARSSSSEGMNPQPPLVTENGSVVGESGSRSRPLLVVSTDK
jgi:hypothetical protein